MRLPTPGTPAQLVPVNTDALAMPKNSMKPKTSETVVSTTAEATQGSGPIRGGNGGAPHRPSQ